MMIIAIPTTQGLTIVWRCSCVARYWKNLKMVKPNAIKDVLVRIHAISVRSLASRVRSTASRVEVSSGLSAIIAHSSCRPAACGTRCPATVLAAGAEPPGALFRQVDIGAHHRMVVLAVHKSGATALAEETLFGGAGRANDHRHGREIGRHL